LEQIKLNTCDTNGKQTTITTIYNQYLIRNYLQKDIKNENQESLGLLGQRSMRMKGVERKGLKASLETAN
jgi:hypothetical protein